MQARTIRFAALAAMGAATLSACGANAPHMLGQYPQSSPKVTATKGERLPVHLTVSLTQPSHVAVFLVVPGRGSTLLYPADSTESTRMDAGSHAIVTSLSKAVASDSMRLIRQPGQQPRVTGQRRAGQTSRDSVPTFGFNQHGYLLLFATPDSLSYQVLSQRVSGISIPIDDDDALNTVAKLIRETNHVTGSWAGYATDFPP